MVHALQEIGRVLVTEGHIVDLRPITDRWPIEISSEQNIRQLGRLLDLPAALADDAAANEAISQVSQAGWLVLKKQEIFDFFYYWDTPEEMLEYIQEEWDDFISVPKHVQAKIQKFWVNSEPGWRIRIRIKMLIALWKKQSGN